VIIAEKHLIQKIQNNYFAAGVVHLFEKVKIELKKEEHIIPKYVYHVMKSLKL